MSYRIENDESLGMAFARIEGEQFDKALRAIDRAEADPDAAVHDVRRRLKKLRALLRLVRFAMPDDYRRRNRNYRDVGRKLAVARDAEARLETLARLEEEFGAQIETAVFAELREHLRAEHRELAPPLRTLELLKEAEGALRTWSAEEAPVLSGKDRKQLVRGIARVYARGRSRLIACQDEGASAEDFHDLRKRAKYLRYQLRLLRPLWPRPINALRRELHDLTDALGAAHDLTVLLAIDAEAPEGEERIAVPLRAAILELRARRRAEALALARRCYLQGEAAFGDWIAGLWRLRRCAQAQ